VVKLISKDNLITYTVNVKTNDTDSRSHFYKLVIITQGNKHDTKLLKFLPNVIEDNTANSSFKGTILNISLEGNSLSAKSCGLTFTVEVFVPCIIHGELSPNDGCWGGHWETQVVDGCGGGGATTWTDNSGNIGGGGDGSYTYNGVYPIYTYSSAEVKQMFDNFVLNDLSSEQQGFLMNNPSTSDAIKEYLSANVNYPEGFRAESKEFAKQLLNLAIVNGATFAFNNNLDPSNSLSFNTVEEFKIFLENEKKEQLNNPDFSYNTFQNGEILAVAKIDFPGPFSLSVDIKQKNNPFTLLGIDSDFVGITYGNNWSQKSYAAGDVKNNVSTIILTGIHSRSILVGGIGTYYTEKVIIKILIDTTNNSIIAAYKQ
jgi:hypothetical protein